MLSIMKGQCLSTISAAVSLLMVLFEDMVQTKPLVYPNRYSFQKTSTTSTTTNPLHDDPSNSTESSGDSSSIKNAAGFRYGYAACIGGLVLVCITLIYFYLKTRRQGVTSRYFNHSPNADDGKADFDSSSQVMVRSSA